MGSVGVVAGDELRWIPRDHKEVVASNPFTELHADSMRGESFKSRKKREKRPL